MNEVNHACGHFASFHAVSQSVFLVSLCKPPRKKRIKQKHVKKKTNKKTFQLFGRTQPREARGAKKKKKNSDGARC